MLHTFHNLGLVPVFLENQAVALQISISITSLNEIMIMRTGGKWSALEQGQNAKERKERERHWHNSLIVDSDRSPPPQSSTRFEYHSCPVPLFDSLLASGMI